MPPIRNPKVPDSYFEKVLKRRELAARRDMPGAAAAIEEELANLDFYQVAANLGEERDPAAMGEIERLLRAADYDGLRARLGENLGNLVRDRFLAAWRQADLDKFASRTTGEMIGDTAVGVGTGVAGTASALGMLAATPLGDAMVADVAQTGQSLNEALQSWTSEGVQSRRRAATARQAGQERDSAFQAQQRIEAGSSPFWAGTERILSDAVNKLSDTASDPTLLMQGSAEAAGSLVGGVGLAKGLQYVGKKVMLESAEQLAARSLARGAANISARSVAGRSAEEIAEKAGKRLLEQQTRRLGTKSWMAATGIQEGGGTYQQVVNNVMALSHDELFATSEEYQQKLAELLAQEVPQEVAQEQAKRWVANRTGQLAGVITGVAGAALGKLAEGSFHAPLGVYRSFAKDALGEGLEEGLQSLSSGVATGVAERTYVDQDRDVLEGLGSDIGESALLGVASSAAMKSPGLAPNVARDLLSSTRAAAGAAGGMAMNAASRLGAARIETAENAQPSDLGAGLTGLNERINTLEGNAQENVQAIQESMQSLLDAGEIAAEDLPKLQQDLLNLMGAVAVEKLPNAVLTLSDENRAAIPDNGSRAEALDAVSRALLKEKDEDEQAYLAVVLHQLMEPVNAFSNVPESLERLIETEGGGEAVNQYMDVLAGMRELPSVKRAWAKAKKILEGTKVQDVSFLENQEGELTPEQENAVATEVARAEIAPEAANPETVATVLKHAESGKIQLTPSQREALKSTHVLLQARIKLEEERIQKAAEKASQALGRKVNYADSLKERHIARNYLSNQEQVGSQVTVGLDSSYIDSKKYSARQHLDRITMAMRSGNKTLATELAQDFALFVEHMNNKVDAVRRYVTDPSSRVTYQEKRGDQVIDRLVTPYQQLTTQNGKRVWVLSTENTENHAHKGEFVNLNSEKSVAHVQEMAAEAELLHDLLTGIVQAYDLNIQIPRKAQLPAQLRKPVDQAVYQTRTQAKSAQKASSSPGSAPKATTKKPKVKTVTKPVKSRISPERARERMSDDDLLRYANAILTRQEKGTADAADQATLEVLQAEIARREKETASTPADQEQTESDNWGELTEEDITEVPPEKSDLQTVQETPTQILNAEKRIQGQEKEHAVAVDRKTNKVIANVIGERDKFLFSREAVKKMQDSGEVVVTHNHPGILSLSIEDILFAHQANLAEIRAVLPNGAVWSVQRPEGGWPQVKKSDLEAKFEGIQSPDPREWSFMAAARERMDQVIRDAGGDPTDGSRAKGFNQARWQQILSEEKAAAFNRISEENGWGWRTEQVVEGEINEEVETQTETDVEVDSDTSVTDLYPGLGTGVWETVTNFFTKSFRIARVDGVPTSRLLGKAEPVKELVEAMDSPEKAEAFAEGKLRSSPSTQVLARYREFLGPVEGKDRKNLGGLIQVLEKNLTNFLNKKRGNSTIGEMFLRGEIPAHRWLEGKVLNLIENQDGQARYNRTLLEQAALAGIQWWIVTSSRQKPYRRDEVMDEFGLDDQIDISETLLRRLAAGQSLSEAKRSLASYIRRFWAVKGLNSEAKGYTDAIPEAMAAEILRAFEEIGLVKGDKITEFKDLTGRDYTPERYITPEQPADEPLLVYPTLIEEMALRNPELISFYGDDPIPVVKTQLNNAKVKLSRRVRRAISNMQAEKFFINRPMVNWLLKLNEEGIIRVFGTVIPENAVMNREHRRSIESQNRSLIQAFRELQRTLREMENRVAKEHAAGNTDITVDTLAKRYQYVVTSVNRIMMLGGHNPQANKLMREALVSTWSTLDLSEPDSKHSRFMALAVAQALGHKVHKFDLDTNVAWSTRAMEDLDEALEILASWLENQDQDFPLEQFQAAYAQAQEKAQNRPEGDSYSLAPLSPLVTNTLLEVARLMNATPAERKAFRTSLYLEADGMTNGPFNSLGLLALEFSETWVAALAKGGARFSNNPLSANQIIGPQDLYKSAAIKTDGKITELRKFIRNQKIPSEAAKEKLDHLLNAMDALMDGDVIFDPETGELTIERGAAKNPMTVVVYGSGINGIANKLTQIMIKDFYAKMSLMAEAGSAKAAASRIFPNDPNPEAKVSQMLRAMHALTSERVYFFKKKQSYLIDRESRLDSFFERLRPSKDGTNPYVHFRFHSRELQNLQANLATLFVEPLDASIKEVLGHSIFESGELMVQATKIQSVVAREAYLTAIKAKIEEKVEAAKKQADEQGLAGENAWKQLYDPNSEFLSTDELNEVFDSVADLMPIVQSDEQSFLIARNSLLEFWNKKRNPKTGKLENDRKQALWQYSRALDESMRTSAYVDAVDDAGVKAIPFLNIGMGDGRMVREIYQTALERSMQVYDGINIPLDRIEEYGKRINEAAYKAWRGNVFKALEQSFNRFMHHPLTAQTLQTNEALREALREDLRLEDGESLALAITQVAQRLTDRAQEMEARQRVLDKYALVMDQMASTYQPYVSPGLGMPEGASDAEIAQILTAEYLKELDKIRSREQAVSQPSEQENSTQQTSAENDPFSDLGRRHPASGVRVISPTSLHRNLSKRFDRQDRHVAQLLGEMLRSGGLTGYRVVIGNVDQIAKYQEIHGHTSLSRMNIRSGEQVHGFTASSEKTIYLIDPSPETLLHEMVHATTLSLLETHYANPQAQLGDNAEKSQAIKGAIQRLEALKDRFLAEDPATFPSFEAAQAYNNAVEAIREWERAGNQAAALNEFMAWTMTNRELLTEFGTRKVEGNALVRIARAAYDAIKRLIWGRKKVPSFGDDFISQLRFNSAILMRSQPTLSEIIAESTTKHAIHKGEPNSRLTRLREGFTRQVAQHFAQRHRSPQMIQDRALDENAVLRATQLRKEAEVHFRMNAEEGNTFQMLAAAMFTEAQLNPHAMIAAEKLYNHFIQNVTPEDFLKGNVHNPDGDYAQATDKLEFLLGRTFKTWDKKNRSSILPVFVALAATSPELREVLARKEMPRTTRQRVVGMDTALENVGDTILTAISNRLAQLNQPANVQAAMDQLTDAIAEVAFRESSALERLAFIGEAVDTTNAKLVNLLSRTGELALTKADELAKSNSKFGRVVGAALEATAAIVSEKEGAVVAERVIEALDRDPRIWTVFRDFTNDLVGRTASNAKVWDMVKRVRVFVSQSRQKYREKVPVVIRSKFTRKLNKEEWNTLYRVMGRYDLVVLTEGRSTDAALDLITDPRAVQSEIARLQGELQAAHPELYADYTQKIDQLVRFIQTGKRGPRLLRNARAIADLARLGVKFDAPGSTVNTIDRLVTLKLVNEMTDVDRAVFSELVEQEREGIKFTLNYLKGQRKTENDKVDGMALYNHYKGHLPQEINGRGRLIVAQDTQHSSLVQLGYRRVGAYKGSSLERGVGARSYYFSPDGGEKMPYQQGIAQNVQETAYGVHVETGFSTELTAGRITDPVQVERLAKRLHRELPGDENLSPIWNEAGEIVAFERTFSAEHLAEYVEQPQDLAKMIGFWRGRQVEELYANRINELLVDHLDEIWTKDSKDPTSRERYVNILNPDELDPVTRDAVSLLPRKMRIYIQNKSGGQGFYVRRSMLAMAVGYRNASVGDLWTGNTRLSKEFQDTARNALIGVFGMGAYRYLTQAERNWQDVMHSVRTNIVVRSLIVPTANFISNVYQLAGRGVPFLTILRGVPKKVAEVEHYTRSMNRMVQLEAEIRANEGNPHVTKTLRAELTLLQDGLKRLSIWPLLEAGEFSTISDVGVGNEDTSGTTPTTLLARLEKAVDELPPGLRDAARQGFMLRDTALFQAMQKMTQYGDFIMKAIYYDHMTTKEKRTPEQALARITEEFINYDLPTGRMRGYFESMGLWWFLNYKLRSIKVALSMIRNNPLHVLMMMSLPHPDFGLSIGIPVTDNLLAKTIEGTMGYSFTPAMAFSPIGVNWLYNILD